jgi:hypothetical protein
MICGFDSTRQAQDKSKLNLMEGMIIFMEARDTGRVLAHLNIRKSA